MSSFRQQSIEFTKELCKKRSQIEHLENHISSLKMLLEKRLSTKYISSSNLESILRSSPRFSHRAEDTMEEMLSSKLRHPYSPAMPANDPSEDLNDRDTVSTPTLDKDAGHTEHLENSMKSTFDELLGEGLSLILSTSSHHNIPRGLDAKYSAAPSCVSDSNFVNFSVSNNFSEWKPRMFESFVDVTLEEIANGNYPL